jgi:hypothetical protein
LERPETSGNVAKRPILGTYAQNSEETCGDREAVRDALAQALESWTGRGDVREARRWLFRALALMERDPQP